MLSLGSDIDTQDYTYDPQLLQESLAGKLTQSMLSSHTLLVQYISHYSCYHKSLVHNVAGNVQKSTSAPWVVSEVEEFDKPCPKSKK